MENLILEAYQKAKTKDFFAITTVLEKLLKQKYSSSDPQRMVTIRHVRQILAQQGLSYTVTV